MPQFIETYIAYFAILKIGCVVLPLFSGYGSKAVIERLNIAKAKGFLLVSSSPLTRSSYHADEDFAKLQQNRLNNH